MPITEDDRGTYIFNSKDLCMIEHIPAMIDSGVSALKIEGRMKGYQLRSKDSDENERVFASPHTGPKIIGCSIKLP